MAVDMSNVELQEKALAVASLYLDEKIMMLELGTDVSYMLEGNAAKSTSIERQPENEPQVKDVVPSATHNQSDVVERAYTKLEATEWKQVDFSVSDQEAQLIANYQDGFIPLQMKRKLSALAKEINRNILSNYVDLYSVHGVAGTTPFGSSINDINYCQKILTDEEAPTEDRWLVFDTDAELNARNINQEFNIIGDPQAIRDGTISYRYGFNWAVDQTLPYHINGGATGVATASTGSIGDKTIGITGTGAINKGDVFSFAGHTQTYVCTEDIADATAATLKFYPSLRASVASSAAITFIGDHKVNIAMQKDAFIYAFKDLDGVSATPDSQKVVESMRTPNGVTLRIELVRQNKQWQWQFDTWYGSAILDPRLAMRLLG